MRKEILEIIEKTACFASENETLDDACLDSLDVVEIAMEVESEFNVLISNDDMCSMTNETTIGQLADKLVDLVLSKTK